MKLRSALLAATVLAAPVAAKAEAINGLYIGAGAGANFLQDQTVSGIRYPQVTTFRPNLRGIGNNGQLKTDTGFVGVASIGYGLGNGLRLELEGSYRQNKITASTGVQQFNGTRSRLNGGGDEMKYGGMLNVLYDFDPNVLGLGFFPAAISPYVGLGVGYQYAKDQNARFYGNSGPVFGQPNGFNSILRTNAGEGSFAYQAILGAAFPIAAVPGLAITAEYRFLGLAESRSYNYQYFAPGTATRAKLNIGSNEDLNHSVMLGVRYAFNAAPLAPAPIPAPPRPDAARTYLVFFDWDRADLTDRARQIIAEAAQATTRVQTTRIEVSGHTDKSGTARYNAGLSVRRAQNVAAELVRLGVPRQAITVQGFGESRPLVNTADGVREPQNRRVEIVLR